MTAYDYLKYIVEQIHSTVVATVDKCGLPVTCVIDMMYADENGLYFLTARHAGVEPKSVFTGIFPPILRQPRSIYASMPSFGFLVLTKICSVKTNLYGERFWR